MSQEIRDSQEQISYDAALKLTPCVSIPQPHEEQIEYPIQIKHEPELILEPEELPDSSITNAEAIADNDETSDARRNKLDYNKCYICNNVFESTEDVRIHVSEHGDMIPYQCSTCTIETGQEFWITSLHRLHSHFRMHVSPLKCPECPNRTCTRGALEKHMLTFHQQSDQAEHICEQCGKKFHNKRSCYIHVRAHKALDEGRFACSFCDKKLSSKTDLVRHERIHTGKRPYPCYSCAKSFRLSRHLSEHIFNVHKKSEQVNDGPVLTCKFEGCDFSTTIKKKYWRHKAKHEPKFQCSQCTKLFGSGRELQKHQHVHTGVKPFQCEQCVKSFLEKRTLLKHLAGHNIDRPGCKTCGITFVNERGLKKHLLKHAAIQPSLGCQYCTKKFKSLSTLARHEKTHKESAVNLIDPDIEVAEETSNPGNGVA